MVNCHKGRYNLTNSNLLFKIIYYNISEHTIIALIFEMIIMVINILNIIDMMNNAIDLSQGMQRGETCSAVEYF